MAHQNPNLRAQLMLHAYLVMRMAHQAARQLSVHLTHWCAQMLESIKGCHEMGYLHRDVKPSNFAMGTDENRRRCYVIDFGLSKRCGFHEREPTPSHLSEESSAARCR